MESPNSMFNCNVTMVNNTSTTNANNSIMSSNNAHNTSNMMNTSTTNGALEHLNDADNLVIPSNFLISTKEIIARFPHNKRVGNYLLGRKLGEGSFAKVKEGLHTLTGQKVIIFRITIFYKVTLFLFNSRLQSK